MAEQSTAKVPYRQVKWDATSLRMFMECPMKYKLGMIEAWRLPDSPVDLDFGSWVHLGIETFYRAITSGRGHDEAIEDALFAVITASWANGPMHGDYHDAWHCAGLVKYKNEKGNPAKCPYSHKGKLFAAPVPQSCSCGSSVVRVNAWVPTSKVKDRYNALRAVCWYADEMRDSHFHIASMGESNWDAQEPLVEVQGRLEQTDGQTLVANFDAVKAFGEELFVVDFKTTGMSLGKMYFDSFVPGVQFDFYNAFAPHMDIGGHGKLPIQGVIIEAFQFIQSGVRFGMRLVRQTEEQRQEFLEDMQQWGAMFAECERADIWPRNRASCMRCQFKPVCSATPERRDAVLSEFYVQARWNPETRKAEPVNVERANEND